MVSKSYAEKDPQPSYKGLTGQVKSGSLCYLFLASDCNPSMAFVLDLGDEEKTQEWCFISSPVVAVQATQTAGFNS